MSAGLAAIVVDGLGRIVEKCRYLGGVGEAEAYERYDAQLGG